MPIGPMEMAIIAFLILLLFGAKRLPEIGRSLGSGMREFKEGIVSPIKVWDKDAEALPASQEQGAAAGGRTKSAKPPQD